VRKRELERLSAAVRGIIDGREVELRDNREGALSVLKNDIHTLAMLKNEQVDALRRDRDALKDTLADISHQLKTPLTSMMLMADLLENAPNEKREEFLANLRTGLLHTDWLVSALLKMAKLNADAVEFTREVIQAEELIRLALEPLQILLELKSQTVQLSAGSCQLSIDRRWTAEALTNVLKNASDYSPEGGEILAECGENPICAWIAVTDSGAGIPNAELAALFTRFEGSRSETGYGIGLPLARAILRGQNGDLQAEGKSKRGGAAFTLKFFK
jgi:signal transduction histidine kinase